MENSPQNIRGYTDIFYSVLPFVNRSLRGVPPSSAVRFSAAREF